MPKCYCVHTINSTFSVHVANETSICNSHLLTRATFFRMSGEFFWYAHCLKIYTMCVDHYNTPK